MLKGLCRVLGVLVATNFPTMSWAQNMAPELLLDGKGCSEIFDWATQPAPVITADLVEMLGTEIAPMLVGSMGKSVVKAVRSQPVSNQWFARDCQFTDAQLSEMGALHEGYIQYLESMRTE